MRTLAMTGIVTVAMISRMTLIEAMRATPPSLRMSDGTRSSAITAHAPAFSAMRACSALVTSIMTPPLSISARPTLTRHSFEDPLLPLPFTFFASMIHPPYRKSNTETRKSFLLLRGTRADYHEAPFAARKQVPRRVFNFADAETVSAFFALLPTLHYNFLVQRHRHSVLDRKFSGYSQLFAELRNFAHRFVEKQSNDSSVCKSVVCLTRRRRSMAVGGATIHPTRKPGKATFAKLSM